MKITINYAMSCDYSIAEQVKNAGYTLRNADELELEHQSIHKLYLSKLINHLEYKRLLQKLHERVKESVTCHL